MSDDSALDQVDALAPLAFYVRDHHASSRYGARFLAIAGSIGEYAFSLTRAERPERPRAVDGDDATIAWALELYDGLSEKYTPMRNHELRRAMIVAIFEWYGVPIDAIAPSPVREP